MEMIVELTRGLGKASTTTNRPRGITTYASALTTLIYDAKVTYEVLRLKGLMALMGRSR